MAKDDTLGERLQQLRRAAGLTQQTLAGMTGLSVWNIRNWEHGSRLPGLAAAYKLSKALGVPLEELAICVLKQEENAEPARKRMIVDKRQP
jgi:transcriptional regulator with XRE-family HTH domain